MRQYLQKSQAKFSAPRGLPSVFRPPPGGAAYVGQPYRWIQLANYKNWAFIAIRCWMTTAAGGDPPKIGRIIRDEADKKPQRRAIRKSLGGPQQHERFEPYEWNDPMRRLFRNPNGPDVAFDLWAWHYLFKKLMGISYWWVRRRKDGIGAGMPLEIWVLPPHWVRMMSDMDGSPSFYNVQSPFGPSIDIPFDEVVTFYEHSPLNRWEGYAVNLAVGEWLDTYESNARARRNQYENGAIPAYHLQLGESYGDPDQEQLERYYTKLDARLRGVGNVNRPIITGPDTEIKALGISPVDMGYHQTEEQIRDNVLCAYEVPKVMVGLQDGMTYGSNAAAQQMFYSKVNPDRKYTGEVVTEKIVSPTGKYERLEHYKDGAFFWDELTPNDPEMKLRTIESRRAGGSITPNQERTSYGDEAYEYGGDDPLVNGQEMPWSTGGRSALHEEIAATGNHDAVRAQSDVAKQIMELQASVAEGTTTREAAIATVQHVYGFELQQAQSMIQAAEVDAAQNGANLTQAFQRALNGSSGQAGGYTVTSRLIGERKEQEKSLADHKNRVRELAKSLNGYKK